MNKTEKERIRKKGSQIKQKSADKCILEYLFEDQLQAVKIL